MREKALVPKVTDVVARLIALAVGTVALPACADSVSRSVDVEATPAAVWSVIGPFCSIKDWLPPVGTCTEDGKVPPTRTLVTKNGKATFVELQTARSDAAHFYTYAFRSSPLPVSHYRATIKVVAKGKGASTVTWYGTYIPQPGKEKDANAALTGIYKAGLDAVKARFTK